MAAPDLQELLARMERLGASDLHMTHGAPPVYRRHGTLEPALGAETLDDVALSSLFDDVLTADERVRFGEAQDLDKAVEASGRRYRLNVSRERTHLCFSFRRIESSVLDPAALGLPPVCVRLAELPRGLVLVTGPTGSGKSTTLASLIDHVNASFARHIVTIEDPIEYLHTNKRSIVTQREVGSDTPSFTSALRHVLRQDPDVILVGEMRDLETISATITAAETGHLVFATLHTVDAPQSVDRIVDAYPSHQQAQIRLQLSLVLEAVISQTLVPLATGDGRVAAFEVLVGTAAVRNLIREARTPQLGTALATGAASGMQSLDQSLAGLVGRGVITEAAAAAYARNPDELARLRQARAA